MVGGLLALITKRELIDYTALTGRNEGCEARHPGL